MVDAKYTLSEGQVITANATTVDSTNQVDLGDIEDERQSDVLARGRGPVFGGNGLHLIIAMSIAADVAGNLTADLHDATATGGTFAAVSPAIGSGAIAQATLVAGYVLINIPLPRSLRRALKIVYTTSADWSASTGAVNAFIHFGHQDNRALPS